MKTDIVLLCAAFLTTASQVSAEILATTHADFSTTAQGANGFQYGYYDGPDSTTATFTADTMQATTDANGPLWAGPVAFHYFMQHPGPGPALRPAVRRYVVGSGGEPGFTGTVRIVGRFFDLNHGSTHVFVAVDPDGDEGPAPRTLILPSTPLNGPAPVMFDVTAEVAPGSTIDFGVLANGDYNADSTGLAAWITTYESAAPTNIVANNYSDVQFTNHSGSEERRGTAFSLVTDGEVGGTVGTGGSAFSTTPAAQYAHAGLLYLENPGSGKVTRFDSLRIDVAASGDFNNLPNLYLLRHNSDPGSINPAQDERYAPLPVTAVYHEANSAGHPYYTFYLGDLPESQRTGYGFAVMGSGIDGIIKVSEIAAAAVRVPDAGYIAAQPAWIEYEGHRYALTFTRGTWEQCEAEAVSYGGHLVSINSEAENEWVFALFGRGPSTYIGLRQNPLQANSEPHGGWTWMDGTVLSDINGNYDPGIYKNWNDHRFSGGSEPNHSSGAGEDYACFHPSVFSGRSTWGDIKNAGHPETSDYRGIIELPSAGSSGGTRHHQLSVFGQANIFGAGMPNPTPSADPGTGGVPAPSLTVVGGEKVVLTAASGSIFTGAETAGPDGAHHATRRCDITSLGGVSGYLNLNNSAHLVGVFVADTSQLIAPPRIDFSADAIGESFESLSPGLGQVFFIGDGLTPGGKVQEFLAPAGATKLYIGIPDAWSGDNTYVYTGPPNLYNDNSGYFNIRLAVLPDPAPRFNSPKLPATGGDFSLVGGQAPFGPVTLSSGKLPPGITIADKTVQGRSSEEGDYTFTLRSQDALSAEATKTYDLTIPAAPKNLIAWWKGDADAQDSVGGHHGTFTGGGATTGPGSVVGDGSFAFSGADLVSVPHAEELNLTGDFTIEGWVARESVNGQEATLISKRSSDNLVASYVCYLLTDGRLSFASRSPGNPGDGWAITTAGFVLPADSLWRHLAVTCSGTTLRFYVNGQLAHTGTHPARPATTDAPLTIGGFSIDGSATGDWPGRIDELSLYSRALKPAEISAIATAESLGKVIRVKPAIVDEDFLFEGGQLTIEGGDGPYSVTLAGGALPGGLEISDTGLVSGPFPNGTYSFTLRVEDSLGRFTQRVFSGVREAPMAAPEGIVAWWPGDNTLADIIGDDHVTIPEDGSVGYGPGRVGRAFYFNGVDQSLETLPYVEWEDEPDEGTEVLNHLPLTIEGWVKPEMRAGTVNTWLPTNVISNDTPNLGGHGFGVHLYPDGSLLNVEVQVEGYPFRNVPGVSFTANVWYHIAVVYTPGNVKTYVDGELKDDFSFTQAALDSADLVRIGRHNDDTGYGERRFFKGSIDELSLYHVALSDEQIADIASAGGAGKTRDDAGLQFRMTAPQTAGDLWTYGSVNSNVGGIDDIDTSSFTLNTLLLFVDSKHVWTTAGHEKANIAFNPSNEAVSVVGQGGTDIVVLPRQVSQHPGSDNRPSVLRWTAPADGRYAVCGSFNGADKHGTTTDIHVFHNGEPITQVNGSLANGRIAGEFMGNGHSFTGIIFAETGDTVDFIVGSNGNYSYDSTGTFASVVPLGATLSPVTNLAIETEDPPETERLWQFQSTYASALPGLSLRLQYAEAETPNAWHDLDVFEGSNSFTRTEGTNTWLLQAALNVPPGNYRFRVTASATGYLDVTGVVFGQGALDAASEDPDDPIPVSAPGEPPPPLPTPQMPAASKLAYKLGAKANATIARQGAVATFTVTQPTPPGTPEPAFKVQWSTTPLDDLSWQNLSSQQIIPKTTKPAQRTFQITTRYLPTGTGIYFRVLTSGDERLPVAGPVVRGAFKPVGPVTITPGPIWEYILLTNTSNNPKDSTGDVVNLGDRITYDLEFRNEGSTPATNVEASMMLPAGTMLRGGESDDLVTQVTSENRDTIRKLVWKIPSLEPNVTVKKWLTVEVTSTGDKISFKKANAGVKCLEIKKATNPTIYGYPHTGKTLDSLIPPQLELYLSADNYAPRVGEVVNFTLNATNKTNNDITDARVTFRVPAGMHVEYLRLPDSFGNFVDTQIPNPSPTSNPALSLYEYGQRQLITWNLGTVPGNTQRIMRFALRVVHDLAATRNSSSGPVPNQLFADDYNFYAKEKGKNRQAFGKGKVPPVEFELSPALSVARAPNLQLSKSAAADGAPGRLPVWWEPPYAPANPVYVTDVTGVGLSAAPPTEPPKSLVPPPPPPPGETPPPPVPGTRVTYKLEYSNDPYNDGDARPVETARNVIIHEEIPAGAKFLGELRRDGMGINPIFVDYRDDKGKVIPANGDLSKTRFLDIRLDYFLAPGGKGVITYDVAVTAPKDTIILSRAHGAKIPKATSGAHPYEGYSIWCENRLFRGASFPTRLACKVIEPASFAQPLIYCVKKYLDPGQRETMEFDIEYKIDGGPNEALQNIAVTLTVPKPIEVDLSGCGAVNASAKHPRPLRGFYLSGESHTLTSSSSAHSLTFHLSHLPGGRHGVLRARIKMPPTPLPASMLDKKGCVKTVPLRAEITGYRGTAPKLTAITRNANLAAFKPLNDGAASGAAAMAARSSPASAPQAPVVPFGMTQMFVGRTCPLSVARGQAFDMQIFFGNVGADALFDPTVAMTIPEGLTVESCSHLYYSTRGLDDGTHDGLGYDSRTLNVVTVAGKKVFRIKGISLARNTMAAVRVRFKVDEKYAYDSIQDISLAAKAPNASGVVAPLMVLNVRNADAAPAYASYANEYLTSVANDVNAGAVDALNGHTFTNNSRHIGLWGADNLQLTNGVIIIPLLGDRLAAIGSSHLVEAAPGNILSDDGSVRIAVAHKRVGGFNIKEVKRNGFAPQTFPTADILKGVIHNTSFNLVAAGGGNLVAAGGGNMVAAGGGNIIDNSTGLIGRPIATLIGNDGSTLVAAGGGNMVAAGGGNMVAAGGGNILDAGMGALIGLDHASLIGMDGGSLIGMDGATLVAAGGGNILAMAGGEILGAAGVTFLHEQIAATLIGNDGSTLIGNDGSTMVAAGAGNLNAVNKAVVLEVLSPNNGTMVTPSGGAKTPK